MAEKSYLVTNFPVLVPQKQSGVTMPMLIFNFYATSRSSRTTFFLRCLLVSNKRWRENGSDATTGKKSYRGATCSSGWQHRRPSDNEMVTFDRSARNGYEAALFVLLEARVQRIRRRLSSPLGSCLLRRRTGAEGARPDPEVTCFNFTRTLMSRKKKKNREVPGRNACPIFAAPSNERNLSRKSPHLISCLSNTSLNNQFIYSNSKAKHAFKFPFVQSHSSKRIWKRTFHLDATFKQLSG